MRKLAIILLAGMALISIATAEYSLKENLTLDLKQSVSGSGYFMTYKYARMPNDMGLSGSDKNGVEALDYSHGSGTLSSEASLQAETSESEEGVAADYDMEYHEALSCIQMQESNQMVFSPMAVRLGTGYYAAQPILYNSLLKEKTWLKNRGSGTSMHHEVEYAHALDKELGVVVKDFISEEDPSVTMLNILEDVTEGIAHIGLLQADPKLVDAGSRTAWKKPLIEVDEDYIGTFHIEKMMNLTASVEEEEAEEEWLPCCFGGWDDMIDSYKEGHGAEGIFDCTCPKIIGQVPSQQ